MKYPTEIRRSEEKEWPPMLVSDEMWEYLILRLTSQGVLRPDEIEFFYMKRPRRPLYARYPATTVALVAVLMWLLASWLIG